MARKYDFEVKDTAEAIRARVKKVEKQLLDLARQVDAMNHDYLMYFRGVESREPAKKRQMLERNMKAFQMPTMASTALRFRHTQLIQRLITLRSYWDRTCRSIEEGTFKHGHGPVFSPLSDSWKNSTTEAEEPALKAPEKAQNPKEEIKPDRRFGNVYDDYVRACAGESVQTKAPSYEAFARSLAKQQKAAEAKTGHDSIRYEVRMKNGEPKLIAVIRRDL